MDNVDIVNQKDKFKVFGLWNWVQNQNRTLSIFLMALKRNPNKSDWQKIAEEMSKKMISQTKLSPRQYLFVPCPARGPAASDHAFLYAESLANFWKSPVAPILRKGGPADSQKKKTKRQRGQIHLEVSEKFSKELTKNKKIIFVDDVVTTGFTAQAAFRALGSPNDFEVWCLAHRRLAEGTSQ